MKKIRGLVWVLVSALIVLSGANCSSGGKMVTTTPVSSHLSAYQSLLINVKSQIEGADAEAGQLKQMLLDLFQAEKLFKRVSTSKEGSESLDLVLNVKIVELNKVSKGARMMTGALAGQAKCVTEVVLQDAKSGKTIGEVTIEGKSSGGSIFAGDTNQSVKRAAEKIVEFVSSSY